MSIIRILNSRTEIQSIPSLKLTVSLTIAIVSVSACSSDGIESTGEPQTLLFNQPSMATTNSALDDPQGSEPQNIVETDSNDAVETISEQNNETDDQSSEASSTTNEIKDEYTELSSTEFVSQLELPQLASTTPVLPRDGEIPTMQATNVLDVDSPAANLLSSLETTSAIALADLNSKLSGGEELSLIEENCLYDYDAAEGKPLLGLQCNSRINLDRLGILSVQEAVFLNTESCTNALSSMEIDGCELFATTMQIKPHTDSLIMAPLEHDGRPSRVTISTNDHQELGPGRTEPFTLPDSESIPQLVNSQSNDTINRIPESILEQIMITPSSTRPSEQLTTTIESANPSNIAISTEREPGESVAPLDSARPLDQSHSGVTIQFGVNGSELTVVGSSNGTSDESANCSIDVTTGELTNGSSTVCDEEFTRISERLRSILTVITDDTSSL